jgi:transposase-like protein
MSGKKQQQQAGSPQGGRRPTGGDPGRERGRFSSRRKMEAVLRLLRGEELDVLSRELGVTAATLSSWRDEFLAAGQAGLKTHTASEPEDQTRDLKALIGDLTIDNECLKALLRKHEERDPLAYRRSKP